MDSFVISLIGHGMHGMEFSMSLQIYDFSWQNLPFQEGRVKGGVVCHSLSGERDTGEPTCYGALYSKLLHHYPPSTITSLQHQCGNIGECIYIKKKIFYFYVFIDKVKLRRKIERPKKARVKKRHAKANKLDSSLLPLWTNILDLL